MKKIICVYTVILSKLCMFLCLSTLSLYSADVDFNAKKGCIASLSACFRRLGCPRNAYVRSQGFDQLSDMQEQEPFFKEPDYVAMSDVVEPGMGIVAGGKYYDRDGLFLNNMGLSSAEDLQEKIDELCQLKEDQLTHIYLTLNNLRVSDLGILPTFKALQYLYLNDNKLTAIPKEIKLLKNLKKLSLFVNQIERINCDDLIGLEQLEDLNLGANKIRVIEPGALGGRNVRHIDLIGNRIVALEKEMFGAVNQVEALDFSHNQIKAIDVGFFCLLSCLKNLNLSNNSMAALNAQSFEGLSEAAEVDVRFNKIERADSLLVRELSGRLRLSLYLCSDEVQRQWLAVNPMPH